MSGFIVDVRNEEQIYKLVKDVIQEFGRIDIWINNAGYSNAAGMMPDMNPQDALEMFMVNDLGVFPCTRAILCYMLPRKQGVLVNTSTALVVSCALHHLPDSMARQKHG